MRDEPVRHTVSLGDPVQPRHMPPPERMAGNDVAFGDDPLGGGKIMTIGWNEKLTKHGQPRAANDHRLRQDELIAGAL